MPTLIDRNGRVADRWVRADASDSPPPSDASVLVPLAHYRENVQGWRAHPGHLGLLLSPADDPQHIASELEHLSLIAIEFPSFTDGRGYSIGRLLRERYRWSGELRAVGDILRDQLLFLARCGFDSFALSDGVDADQALSAFADFDEHYQADALRDAPFERRSSAQLSLRQSDTQALLNA